jgi:hypothetical protein
MNKLAELGYWLWREIQLGAPPFIQSAVMPFFHQIKEIARLVTQSYMPIYELVGQNQGGTLKVAYGGLGYAKPILKDMLFREEPVERKVGRLFVWNPRDPYNLTDSDLIIIESSQHLTHRLPKQGTITLPFRVRFVLDIRGNWEEVVQRFRRDARRNDVQKAKRFGYEYEISHSEADLVMFYHDMYLPTVRKRHGALAALLPKREAYQLLRHGRLFLAKRDGTYVAGGLCYVQQGVLGFAEMGVLNGDEQLMKEGAVGAMNYLCIRWAHQQGFRGVNLGSCWPYLSGIFRNKRKWGATVSTPPYEHKRIWIRIQRNTPAVSQFLQSNPCVIVDSRGELQGLIVTDDPDNITPDTEAMWRKRYATPGLSSLLVCSMADLMANSDSNRCFKKAE